MSKIICDVCGTRYPDSSNQCPICGCIRNAEQKEVEVVAPEEEMVMETRTAVRGGRFSKANVRKRNMNQPVYEEPAVSAPTPTPDAQEAYDAEEEFEAGSRRKGNVILNILLVLVIAALLVVSAYIFLQYFMPNLLSDRLPQSATEATEMTEAAVTDAPTEAPTEALQTEAPEIPCQQLVMEVTDVTLHEAGEMFLLNVQVLPADCTDTVMYISSNEEVATVNEEGRVTAVGEGSVVISIFCGEQQTEFHVVCDFAEEEATEAPAEGETEAPAEGETEAPVEETEAALKDVTLSVKTADMTFKTKGQQSTIKLTCDLTNQEVTWSSENESIATVDKDGIITRVGAGTTTIIGKYGEQTVEIIVRCPRK